MRARLRYRFRGCAARLRTVAIAANGFACLRRVEHPSAQPSVLRQCCHGEDLSMRAGLSAVAVLQPGLVDRSFAQPHLRPKRSMISVVCPARAGGIAAWAASLVSVGPIGVSAPPHWYGTQPSVPPVLGTRSAGRPPG